MDRSGCGDGCKKINIDASVGALVWVCRRNGSWWPGRILGLDELSENCLVSPRSGTPVKLLGREDASVDWYNLEKSKRVKAFRCGEYDKCIEKAKISAANSSKKALKYARREDAILHALKLESAHEGKEPLNFCAGTEISGGETDDSARDSPGMSHSGDDDDDEVANDGSNSQETSNSVPELPQSGISFEDPNHRNTSKVSVQGRRRKTLNDLNDDGSEGVKRMRGLEDLGMCVGSKSKAHAVGASELNQKSGTAPCNSNTIIRLENGENSPPTLKRKRSQVVKVHDFLKRKNRCRPLTKVFESTAMVSVPVTCDQLPGTSNEPLSNRSVTKMIGSSSNSNKIGEKASDNGCNLSNLNHKAKENGTASDVKLDENGSSDKLYDVPFVGDLDENNNVLSPTFAICSSKVSQADALGLQPLLRNQGEGLSRNDDLDESESTSSSHRGEKSTSKWQRKGKRNSRHTCKSRIQVSRKHVDMDGEQDVNVAQKNDCNVASPTSDDCILQKRRSVSEVQEDGFEDLPKQKKGTAAEMKRLDDSSVPPQRSLPYRQSCFTFDSSYQVPDFPGRSACSVTGLYDVKLEVKASYRPQHVPLVSLMSKLNGKAIVGHPLTIEVLSDGQWEFFLREQDLQAKLHQVPSNKNSSLQSRIYPKKSKGRKSILYKKTRTLSSLTGHKQSDEDRKPVIEKLKGPVITCIPLNVVFSRINEAINGLTRATHRVSSATNS